MTARSQPVFIGPVAVGKSTVSTLVADELRLRRVELDAIAMAYYRACPQFDPDEYNRLHAEEGFVAAYRSWEPALAFAVEQVVSDYRDCVLDLGAGHTSFLDKELHVRVRRALAPCSSVVLLLPSRDADESIAVIRHRLAQERHGDDWIHDGVDFVDHWVRSPQNARLATHTIYTADESPDDIAALVLELSRRA